MTLTNHSHSNYSLLLSTSTVVLTTEITPVKDPSAARQSQLLLLLVQVPNPTALPFTVVPWSGTLVQGGQPTGQSPPGDSCPQPWPCPFDAARAHEHTA